MNEPVRFRDGDEVPADVREALRAADGPVPPDASQFAAMRATAVRLAAVAPVALPFVHRALANRAVRALGWKGVGLVSVAAIAGVTRVATTINARSHTPVPVHARAHTVASAPVVKPATVPDAIPAPTSLVAAPVAVVSAPPVAPPLSVVDAPALHDTHPIARASTTAPHSRARTAPLAIAPAAAPPTVAVTSHACPVTDLTGSATVRESRFVDAATASLAHDPAATLACLARIGNVQGVGTLRDERWYLGFEAARTLGRTDDARRFGETLLVESPASPYAAHVRRWLANTPR